jgi:RimJ/RimL family protein N-acetyltransferase
VRIVIGEASAAGRGLGTESIGLLCDYAFQRLNLHKVIAYVLEINPRAKRAFEKAGFTCEGTLKADRWVDDRYTDVHILGRLR